MVKGTNMHTLRSAWFWLALLVAVPAFAQNGAAALGAALGRGSQLQRDAYQDEQARMLQTWALAQQANADMAVARRNDALLRARQTLAERWQEVMGLDAEHADAVANAYHPADDDEAVILSLRGITPQAAAQAIRAALDARDFRRADQLLIGALVEAQRLQGSGGG